MLKTITITKLESEQMPSKTSHQQNWRYTWQIVDEKRQQRFVVARITYDSRQLSSRFQAINVREMPLVEALLKHQQGDIFTIDFTEFNQRHCYDTRARYSAPYTPSPEHQLLFTPKNRLMENDGIEVHGFI